MATEKPTLQTVQETEYHNAAHRGEFLSFHMLNEFRKCPRDYKRILDGELTLPTSPCLDFGRAAHKYILEGEVFWDTYSLADPPINEKTGKPYGKETAKYGAWLAEHEGENLIEEADAILIEEMSAAVRAHEIAGKLLENGYAEKVARAEYCGKPCQCRYDWINPKYNTVGAIVDLKTTCDITQFEWDARKRGYPRQLAFYREMLHALYGIYCRCYIVAVEKVFKPRVGVWEIPHEYLLSLARENTELINELKDCERKGVFPTRYEGLKYLDEIKK